MWDIKSCILRSKLQRCSEHASCRKRAQTHASTQLMASVMTEDLDHSMLPVPLAPTAQTVAGYLYHLRHLHPRRHLHLPLLRLRLLLRPHHHRRSRRLRPPHPREAAQIVAFPQTMAFARMAGRAQWRANTASVRSEPIAPIAGSASTAWTAHRRVRIRISSSRTRQTRACRACGRMRVATGSATTSHARTMIALHHKPSISAFPSTTPPDLIIRSHHGSSVAARSSCPLPSP
mmetsp:Transcript_34507/g.95166  ORF Transcript_34507/g.95166 Transcript_34507/m.95166 type:complete len:233 (-) Transcript_34507:63-761(-)